MNNFIDYFYNIKIDSIKYNNHYYSFIFNGYNYRLYILEDNININSMINLNKKMLGYTLVSEIINNRWNNYISNYNGLNYILIKIYINIDKAITLEEINNLASYMYSNKNNLNWGQLWSKKIDYLEELINENGKKYPIIVDSFNYFVGMAENAISYYNDIIIDNNYKSVISHKRIRFNDTVEALYNPLNIIFDYKVRDIAEYIKNAFFLNNKNIFYEFDNYLKNNHLDIIDIKLLISRLMYPSFYFDLYEDILVNGESEKIIIKIIDRLPHYEKYLASIISYLKNMYDVNEIAWLKNSYNIEKKRKNED